MKPTDLVLANGFLWPPGSEGYCERYIRRADDMSYMMPFVRFWDVVVQAGGHCGVWPAWLSSHFQRVYTFEPEPTNFMCLVRNAWRQNIYKFNAALVERPGLVDLAVSKKNIGGHSVKVGVAGEIVGMTIDQLGLDRCDAIQLDIEGFELPALRGAIQTLQRYRPVLMLENAGHGSRKGAGDKWVDILTFLSQLGYVEGRRVHQDVILTAR